MAESKTEKPDAANQRLRSLDALRGFDMFWIMGGEEIVHAAAAVTGWSAFPQSVIARTVAGLFEAGSAAVQRAS